MCDVSVMEVVCPKKVTNIGRARERVFNVMLALPFSDDLCAVVLLGISD